MSTDGLTISFTAPERASLEVAAEEVTVPGAGGVFTVYPGHTSLLSTLLPGVVQVTDAKGVETYYSITGGFAEIKDNTVAILADAFEPGPEVEIKRAERARTRAEDRMRKPDETVDLFRAEAALARASARIQAHKGEGH